MGGDEALQSPIFPTATVSSSGATFSDLPSATEHPTMSDPIPFVVNEALSKTYYKACPLNHPSSLPPNPTPSKNQLAPRHTLSPKSLGCWVTTPSLVFGTMV